MRNHRIAYVSLWKSQPYSAASNRIALVSKAIEMGKDHVFFYSVYTNFRNPLLKHFTQFVKIAKLINIYKDLEIIIIYGDWYYPIITFFLSLRYKIVFERNEYPGSLINNKASVKTKINDILTFMSMRSSRGLITCTHVLKRYYLGKSSKNVKSIIIPTIIDASLYIQSEDKENFICYCGSANNSKDGIYYLLEAFSLIMKDKPLWSLKLILSGTQLELKNVIDLIDRKKISERTIVIQNIDHNRIPVELSKCAIFVMPRPNSLQARGGFPSKLVEYLISGRPTIVSDTSEITKYFSDNENLYILPNIEAASIARMLSYVIENPSSANMIAKNGYRKAKEFNYPNFSGDIIGFLNSL